MRTVVVVFLIPPQPYGARTIPMLIAAEWFGVGAIVAIALQWHTSITLALILDLFQAQAQPDGGAYPQLRGTKVTFLR